MYHGFSFPVPSTNNLTCLGADPSSPMMELPYSLCAVGSPVAITATLSVENPDFKLVSYISTITIRPHFFHLTWVVDTIET